MTFRARVRDGVKLQQRAFTVDTQAQKPNSGI